MNVYRVTQGDADYDCPALSKLKVLPGADGFDQRWLSGYLKRLALFQAGGECISASFAFGMLDVEFTALLLTTDANLSGHCGLRIISQATLNCCHPVSVFNLECVVPLAFVRVHGNRMPLNLVLTC